MDLTYVMLVLALLAGAICAAVGAQAATNRGLSAAGGGLLGFFLGPVGLGIVLLLGRAPADEARWRTAVEAESERLRAAPPPRPAGPATAEEDDELAFLAFRAEGQPQRHRGTEGE